MTTTTIDLACTVCGAVETIPFDPDDPVDAAELPAARRENICAACLRREWEKPAVIAGIMAELARLEAEDDNPESPF